MFERLLEQMLALALANHPLVRLLLVLVEHRPVRLEQVAAQHQKVQEPVRIEVEVGFRLAPGALAHHRQLINAECLTSLLCQPKFSEPGQVESGVDYL
jgi:hypothetical protein